MNNAIYDAAIRDGQYCLEQLKRDWESPAKIAAAQRCLDLAAEGKRIASQAVAYQEYYSDPQEKIEVAEHTPGSNEWELKWLLAHNEAAVSEMEQRQAGSKAILRKMRSHQQELTAAVVSLVSLFPKGAFLVVD